MALSDATRLADFSSTVPSFGDINAIGVVTATGGMDGIGIHSGGNVIHSGIITALNFIGTGNTFAINGTTVDISISGAAGTDNINTGTAATFGANVSIADSIFHIGDDDTHFGFPAADTFALSAGGVQRLNISQTVNITPEDNQADAFSVKQGSNEYITVDTTNSSERVTIGNVTTNPEVVILSNTGIGTTNPEKPLHVFSATGDSMTRFESGDATIQLELKDNAGSAAIGAVGNEFRILTSGGGGDERLRIDSSGNVGIGTDEPTDAAHALNTAKLNVGIVTARQYFGDGSNLSGTGHAVGSGQTTITSTSTFNNSGSFARFAEMDASYTTVGTGPILVTFSWSLTQNTTSSDLSWKLFRKIGAGAASEILVNPSLVGSSSSGMIPNFRGDEAPQGNRISYSFIDSPGHSAGDLITYEHHINCEGSNTLNLNHGAQTASRHCTTVSTITFLELAS